MNTLQRRGIRDITCRSRSKAGYGTNPGFEGFFVLGGSEDEEMEMRILLPENNLKGDIR